MNLIQPNIPLVDREPEMDQMKIALQSAKAGIPPLVLVIGDSGTGKSFLVDTFLRESENIDSDLVAACGSGQPLAGRVTSLQPIREILEYLTGFSDSRSSAVRSTQDDQRLKAIRQRLLSSLITDTHETLAAILPVITFDQLTKFQVEENRIKEWLKRPVSSLKFDKLDNPQIIQRSIARLLKLVNNTLAIVLDDIQWVDPASIQIFMALQRELRDHKVILIATARTDDEMAVSPHSDYTVEQLRSSIMRDGQNILIDLNNVRRTRGRKFCSELLKVRGFDPSNENVEQFLHLTGANPLFARDVLEPLTKSVATINEQQSKAHLELMSIDWDKLPKNHTDTMQRRFQQLGKDATAILEIAAIEGQEFTAETIARIKGMDLLQVLDVLEVELGREHSLIEDISINPTRGLSPAPPPRNLSRFKFSHGYYQQFIYNVRIGPARRRELHRRVGLALEELWHPTTDLIAAQLAQHFDTAGDKQRAIIYYAVAARRNIAVADFEAASFCAEAGLAVAGQTNVGEKPDELNDLYTVGTSAARARGNFTLAAKLAKEGLDSLATPSPLVLVRLKSELARSLYNLDTGFSESESLLREAIEIAKNEEEWELEADLYRQRGIVFQRQARYVDALKQYLQALRIASVGGGNLVSADIINSVGVSFGLSGFFEFAVICHEKALELTQRFGDASRDTLFLNDCAAPMRRLNRPDDSIKLTKQSIRLAKEQGKTGALVRAKYEQAQIARIEEDWDRYASLLREVYQQGVALGGQSPHVRKALAELVFLSLIHPSVGNFPTPGPDPYGTRGVTGTTEMHSVDFVLGVCALRDGNLSQAVQHFRMVNDSINNCRGGICWAWPFLMALASYGESACLVGDERKITQERAAQEVEQAHLQFGLPGVWRDLAFYGRTLSKVSGTSWPGTSLESILGASNRPAAISALETIFREQLDQF